MSAQNRRIRTLLDEQRLDRETIAVQQEKAVRAQHDLDAARDRYADLYDFAPIGYVSLGLHGRIVDINLAGSALLDKPRDSLIGQPFASFIEKSDRDRFRDFMRRAPAAPQPQPTIEIHVRAPSDNILRLLARPATAAGARELFTAMLDVTDERRLEDENLAAFEREQMKRAELHKEIGIRLNAEERAKALLDRLVTVQEQEKRRLALNLHDHLGQQLTALKLALDALRNAPPGTAEAREHLEFMEKVVSRLDADVDLLAWQLRPAALDDVGLEAALEEFLRQWSAGQRFKVDFHASLGDGPRLPSDVESHLYRIVQEALNNVSKHAKAKHTSVLLDRRGDEVTLIIEDDGRGFDLEAQRRKHDGLGLAGMLERAASIGGELQLESSPGKGTTLFVRLPIRPSGVSA